MELLVLQVMFNAYLCIEKEENSNLFAVKQECQCFFEFNFVFKVGIVGCFGAISYKIDWAMSHWAHV